MSKILLTVQSLKAKASVLPRYLIPQPVKRPKVKLSLPNEVDAAIAAADQAFKSWSQQSPLRRARILFKFKELLEANFDELARLISSEHGKIYSDAIGELTRGLEVVEFATGIPHLQKVSSPPMQGVALIFTQSSNRWA